MEYIQGEKFYDIADQIYSPVNNTGLDDYNHLQNTFDVDKLLYDRKNIIYCHTMYVKELFNTIKNLMCSFIVITHNSDVNVDDSFEIPQNVFLWYTQNVNTINNRVRSLPIGLENSRWFPELKKIETIKNKLRESKEIRNLLYVNHVVRTNTTERAKPYELFTNKFWANLVQGVNGQKFDEYVDNIYNHKFVLCPAGNGIDTHRLWECLYLNTIPIVKRNINNRFYANLPMCFVNDWNEITYEFLSEEYTRINANAWDLRKLDMNYWKQLIVEYR